MKFLCLLATIAAVAAGCGASNGSETAASEFLSPEDYREVVVALDGRESPENVGLVMAEASDCFKEEGLKVSTLSPVSLDRSIGAVVDRSDQFGIAHLPQVLIAAAKGAPIVVVGSLVSEPTLAMIWLRRAKIRRISDLRGKTIAIPGLSFQMDFLESYLAKGGVTLDEVEVVRTRSDLVPALVSGRADAAFGGSWNVEGVDLESRGLEPVITPVAPFLGLPAYDELVVIARDDQLSDPELTRDFLSAVACGTDAAIRSPGETAEATRSAVEWNSEPSDRATRSALAATLPLLAEDGRADPEEARALGKWMQEEAIVPQAPAVSSLFTDEYLPQS